MPEERLNVHDDKEEDEEESAIQTQIEDDFAVALCVPHVLISYPVGDTNAANYTVHKHIQTNKTFNKETHTNKTFNKETHRPGWNKSFL